MFPDGRTSQSLLLVSEPSDTLREGFSCNLHMCLNMGHLWSHSKDSCSIDGALRKLWPGDFRDSRSLLCLTELPNSQFRHQTEWQVCEDLGQLLLFSDLPTQ